MRRDEGLLVPDFRSGCCGQEVDSMANRVDRGLGRLPVSAKSAREVSKGGGSGAHGKLESGYTACQMSDFCEPAGRVALSTCLLRTAHASSTGAP